MSSYHIMVDLETFSLANDAAIAAIGAVRVDRDTLQIIDTFYRTVNLKSSQRGGGRIDADTVMWWMVQSDMARTAITTDDGILIDTALRDFANWVREKPLEGLWGNGAGFDNVILEGAYLRKGWTAPWTYKENRCYRTIVAENPNVSYDSYVGVAHHALDDAMNQAKHLIKIWKAQ